MANPTQVRQIRISVDTKGSEAMNALSKQLGGINRNVQSLSGSMSLLKNSFLGYLGAISVGQLAGIADSMSLLRDRIGVLTGSTEAGNAVFDQLQVRAKRTRVDIEDLATTYSRFAGATSNLGISSNTLLDVVETLQNSFRLSGATAEEAAGSSIQLAQAFSLGKLQGQELRSVMLGNVVVAKLLRAEYGDKLSKAAEQGLITPQKLLTILLKSQQKLREDAEKLGQTFGQTITNQMTDFKVAIDDLNVALGLNKGFASAVDLLRDKLGLLAVAFGLMASLQIPSAIAAVVTFTKVMYFARAAIVAFIASNPLTLAFAAIAAAIVYAFDNFKQFTDFLKTSISGVIDFGATIIEVYNKAIFAIGGYNRTTRQMVSDNEEVIKSLRSRAQLMRDAVGTDPNAGAQPGQDIAAEMSRREAVALSKQGNKAGKEKKIREYYADLNKLFDQGKITASAYYFELDKLDKLKLDKGFKEGRVQLDKLNEGMAEIEKRDLTRAFNVGSLSVIQFRDAIRGVDTAELDRKLQYGRINLLEYDAAIIQISDKLNAGSAFRVGTYAFVESIGTIGMNVAEAIQNTFGSLETSLMDFIKTGKFNFAQFTQGILDDLMKIIIRAAIIRPLAEGLLGGGSDVGGFSMPSLGSGSTGATPTYGVGGVYKYAKGGVVSAPTSFAGGKGLMGEAGPEAIMPLSRGSDGKLGVAASVNPVSINIINNTGGEVETRERQGTDGRIVDVIINRKVQEGLANGTFDKAMSASYGLKRRGN